jgi:hypothetical protein
MATYYLDPAAGGGDTGVDWANAWSTIQRAKDGTNGTPPAAGDTVFCRGTETLGVAPDIDGNEGNTTNGYIKFVGTNGAGTVDGTRYELDGNGAAASCLVMLGEMIWFENFEMHSATSHGVDQTSSDADTCTFYNCSVHNNIGAGFYNDSNATDCCYLRNLIYTNGTSGIREPHVCCMVGNVIYNNGEEGIEGVHTDNSTAVKNAIFDNGDGESNMNYDKHWLIMNNVIDGTGQANGTGIESNGSGESLIIENRITNSVIGFDNNSDINMVGFNVFDNNTDDIIDPNIIEKLRLDATVDTNLYDPDADDGYENAALDKYNLKASRSYNGDGTDVIGLNHP